MKYKFIDLFAGIGGFYKAIEKVAKNKNFEIECVFSSEIDKEAIKVYSHNFKKSKEEIIDIRLLDEYCSQVPEHDILFAGFPCQTFSNAGNKKGFEDEIRGTLFFDIVKILKAKKPKYILLENVKHLVKHDKGRTWTIIKKVLEEELNYLIPEKPLILSPHSFGIPQNRERVFIPGILKEKQENKIEQKDFIFSFDSKKSNKFINILEKNVDEKYFLQDEYLIKILNAWDEFVREVKFPETRTLPVIWLDEFDQNYELKGLVPWRKKYLENMREFFQENYIFIKKWMQKHNVSSWKLRDKKFEWQAGKEVRNIKNTFIQMRQSGIRCKKAEIFPTLVAMVQTSMLFDKEKNKWRYITPREAANLQTFPKNFILHNELNENHKDHYTYKQLGNSVNIFVVALVIEKLLEYK
ncbi:DNA (cytosine-5-)-methyltransferase [Mycoplasma sp. 1012]